MRKGPIYQQEQQDVVPVVAESNTAEHSVVSSADKGPSILNSLALTYGLMQELRSFHFLLGLQILYLAFRPYPLEFNLRAERSHGSSSVDAIKYTEELNSFLSLGSRI